LWAAHQAQAQQQAVQDQAAAQQAEQTLLQEQALQQQKEAIQLQQSQQAWQNMLNTMILIQHLRNR
jgi:hypothetical protein